LKIADWGLLIWGGWHMAQVETAKDSKRVVVDLMMTVEEARQVIWEDAYNPRGPIGDLLDAKKIGYNNLAWGVEGAWKPEMRMAARTLLAYWLGKPTTAEATRRFGPEVVEGSHYLEEQETDGMAQFIIYMIGGIFLVIFAVPSSLLQILSNKTNPIPLPIAIAVNLTVALICGLWLYKKTKQEFARWKNSRRGRKGEQTVVDRLRTILDNRWTIFRNLHLPDRKDDIDIVLAGPGGVWAIEVKAFGGTVRTQGDTWASLRKGKWVQLRDSPSVQAKKNAARTRDFLQRSGVNIRWVEAIVTLAESQPIENFVASKDLAYWFLPTLESKAANLVARALPTDDEIKRITGLLRELATKQVAIEEAKYKKN
jgi:hypothetical protein